MWDRKCIEMNTYLGGARCSETWKFIKKIRSENRNSVNIQLIPTKKWVDHYEQLLTGNRDKYKTMSLTEVIIEGQDIIIETNTRENAERGLINGIPGPEGIPAELWCKKTISRIDLLL